MPEADCSKISPPPSRLSAEKRQRLADLRRAVRTLEAPPLKETLRLGDETLDAHIKTGLVFGAVHDIRPAAYRDGPAALGFLLGLAVRALQARDGALVWVGRKQGFDFGALYGPGLAAYGLDVTRLWLIEANNKADALWACEEAARTPGLAAIIAESGVQLDLVAGRRLQLAAESENSLVLLWSAHNFTSIPSSRTQWRIAARLSLLPDWAEDIAGWPGPPPLGAPAFRVELMRCKGGNPVNLEMEWVHAAHSFRLPAAFSQRLAQSAA